MSTLNSDEIILPSWMNEQFFEDVLRKCEHTDKISVQNIEMAPASTLGDHYASSMFRVMVTFDSSESTGQTKSMVIKTMPEIGSQKREVFEETFVFETEIGMYSKMIPKFEEELRKVGDDTVLAAKALYYSLEPRKVIVFEDIGQKGYEVLCNRMANMEEAKVAFLKLSKWHAVSYKLNAEGDQNVSSYCGSFFNREDIENFPFMTTGIDYITEKLDTITDLKKYVPHLKRLNCDILKKCVASVKAYTQKSPQGVFVLSHGDFHLKNIMIKRNENKELQDVLLIDFQMCSFSPAILDVLYGIYLLLDPQIRLNNFDEIMYFYCSNFIDTLKKLKFQGEIPKISDFYIDMYRHRHWEIFLMTSFLPLWYALLENRVSCLDEVLGSDEVRKTAYDNPNYLNDVKQMFQRMFHRGYFE